MSRVTSLAQAHMRRRGLLFVALGAAVVAGLIFGIVSLESTPAASGADGNVAKATRGSVVVTVGGVGRIVQSGLAADISVPTASPGGAVAAAAGGSSTSSVTSATSVFPQTSGSVTRFLVVPGQHVVAGQPLALLGDRGTAASAISLARNDVATAVEELRQKRTSDPLKGTPPTPAELSAGRSAVTSARFRLAQLLHGARPADISAARLDVRRAQADLEALQGGSPEAQAEAIQLAQENVALSQQRLDKLLAPPSPADVATAQAEVRKAESDLALLLRPGSGALPQEIASARAAQDAARARLERLLAPASTADVAAAQLDVDRANADLRKLKAGPSAGALAAARQAVESARAKLAQLLSPPLKSDVAAARFDILKAQADLAVLRARGGPASGFDIALARLKVVGAQLRLATARSAKPLLTVRAPETGTVTALLTVPGAPVDSLTPIAAVADLDRLAVDVDLSEFDVAQVRRGMRAVVRVDALGGKPFRGKVAFAALTGTNAGGVVTFPVRVDIARSTRLRPGMNVSVRIIVARRAHVIVVPVDAVSQDEDGQTIVNVVDADGNSTPRAVTLGLSSNKTVEIRKGLRAGERVALPQPEVGSSGEGD